MEKCKLNDIFFCFIYILLKLSPEIGTSKRRFDRCIDLWPFFVSFALFGFLIIDTLFIWLKSVCNLLLVSSIDNFNDFFYVDHRNQSTVNEQKSRNQWRQIENVPTIVSPKKTSESVRAHINCCSRVNKKFTHETKQGTKCENGMKKISFFLAHVNENVAETHLSARNSFRTQNQPHIISSIRPFCLSVTLFDIVLWTDAEISEYYHIFIMKMIWFGKLTL